MEMSLWMKIALVIMAVASVMGVAAFVLVIKHVTRRKTKTPECSSYGVKKYSGRYPWGDDDFLARKVDLLETRFDMVWDRILTIERAMDNEADNDDCNSVCGIALRAKDLDDRIDYVIDKIENGIDLLNYRVDEINYRIDEVNKRIDKMKKRVKALEEKEG